MIFEELQGSCHLVGKGLRMQEMPRLRFLVFLAGLWLSLEEAQCDGEKVGLASGDSASLLCCDTEASAYEHDEHCKTFMNGKPLPVCDMSHHRQICKYSVGDAANKQCICKKDDKSGGKLWCCPCKNNHCATICHKVEQPNAISPASSSPSEGQFDSPNIGLYQILLILLLIMVVVFIVVAVVLFMRKRKSDKRNEWSPVTYTTHGETVPNVYAGVSPDNRPLEGTAPAGNHIYDELDMMIQDPTPSNVYSEVQSTSVAVDMGRSVDYVDIDLPIKDQQKPMSTSKVPLSLSPVYSQPFVPPTSASNTEYAEPFKPDTTNTATAPVLNHYDSSAAGEQQNVYSLAKAIPLSEPNVIYSQPNKPTKSSEPAGKAGGATDPTHLEAIEVKPEAGGVVTQDPNAVYAEPMKLKKSS